MGPTALGAMAWRPPTVAEWLALGLTAGEILAAAIVVAVLVTLVFPPPHERAPLNPPIRPVAPIGFAPADQTPRPHPAAQQLGASSEPIRTLGADADASSAAGARARCFEPVEAPAEAVGAALSGDGRTTDDPPPAGTDPAPQELLARRLAFARWLAQQGRLSG